MLGTDDLYWAKLCMFKQKVNRVEAGLRWPWLRQGMKVQRSTFRQRTYQAVEYMLCKELLLNSNGFPGQE